MRESGILMPVSSLPGPYGIGSQQEQVEEAFFVRGDFFESQRHDGRVFLSGWGT